MCTLKYCLCHPFLMQGMGDKIPSSHTVAHRLQQSRLLKSNVISSFSTNEIILAKNCCIVHVGMGVLFKDRLETYIKYII